MPPEHLYYKEVNAKDGNYYRRWASAIGPAMSELIDRLLKSSKHEEQSYNACAGILHKVKAIPVSYTHLDVYKRQDRREYSLWKSSLHEKKLLKS